MHKEKAIDYQFIRPIEVGTSAMKGKVPLRNLFKEYFRKLNVGFYDPCCDDNATCPPISAQPDNSLQCLPDGLYVESGIGNVLSVGLTMPSAFSVAGSPVTSTGILAVTAVGTTAQYIRGDGSLAILPSGLITIYNGDGTLESNRIITGDGFSTTFTDLSLFRIVNGDSTLGGTFDFTTGVDFLAYNATNSSNLVLDPLSGLRFQYTTLAGPVVNSSLEVTPLGVKFTGIQVFADNAAAITGGLTAGYLYRTGDTLKIVH